jgi:hypothetical protein
VAFPSGWPLCVYGLANRIRLRIRSCRKVSELFRYRNSHKRCETERTIRRLIGGDDGLVRWNQTEMGPGPSHLPPMGLRSPSSPANIHLFEWLVSQLQHDSARHFAIVRENARVLVRLNHVASWSHKREWQHIGNEIEAAFIFAGTDFVNMHGRPLHQISAIKKARPTLAIQSKNRV